MLKYILEIIIFQALFIGVYQFVLRRETFFNVNRFYLIGTALLAYVLPFMEFELFQNQIALRENMQFLPEVILGTGLQIPSNPVDKPVDQSLIFLLIYAAGVLFSGGILFWKYQEISRYFRFKRKGDNNLITIPNSDAAFTFMGTIFLGEKITPEAKSHIVAHEEVHIKQYHSFDLLLFEVLRVAFWFNPLVYIYQFKVAELHEFIADSHAANKTERRSYYNQLLNTAFGTQHISFVNTFFNHSLIKKRIVMLQKQSKNSAKWKYLILLPLFAGILTYVGCSDDNAIVKEEERSLLLKANNKTVPPPPPAPPAPLVPDAQIIEVQQELTDVPFAVIEEVPTFPGCEGLNNKERKACMSGSISSLVNKNFNTALGKELGLEGVNRIYVRFKIDKEGNIVDIGSRASDPKLEQEAERVIKLLPKMTPGKQKGEPVGVLYSLPIVFKVSE